MERATWEEAMGWWKNSDKREAIRDAAVQRLIRHMPPGQGVGSSDTNHSVYHLYGDYLSYVQYCKEKGEEVDIDSFLVDAVTD